MLGDCQEEGWGLYQICVKLQADRVFAWLENPKEIPRFCTFNLTSGACRHSSLYHCLKEEQIRNLTAVTGICAEGCLLFQDLFESLCWTMEAQYCFKVYPASAYLLLPPLVQLSEVLLAFLPRLVELTSDPPHLGSS